MARGGLFSVCVAGDSVMSCNNSRNERAKFSPTAAQGCERYLGDSPPLTYARRLVNYEDPFEVNYNEDPDDDFVNPGLAGLLRMERVIFAGLGVIQSQLAGYLEVVEERCPDFPDAEEWVSRPVRLGGNGNGGQE
eukprot:87021-Prorocentrum_minimum.AAC.2